MNLSNWFYPTGVLFEISVPTFLLWGAFQGHTIFFTQQLENHFHSWRNVYKVHCEKSNKLCSKRDLLSSLIVVKHRVTFRAIFNSFNFPSYFEWQCVYFIVQCDWSKNSSKIFSINQMPMKTIRAQVTRNFPRFRDSPFCSENSLPFPEFPKLQFLGKIRL